jgi:hypothetical protein
VPRDRGLRDHPRWHTRLLVRVPTAGGRRSLPDEAEIEQIANRPRPPSEKLFGRKVAAADAWTLHGPGATETADHDYAGADPNGKALAAMSADDAEGRRVTAGMQCFAVHGAVEENTGGRDLAPIVVRPPG